MGGGRGPGVPAAGSPLGHRRDLLPGLLGGRGRGHARHTAGNRQVAHLLRAEGAEAGSAGAGAGPVNPYQSMSCPEVRVSLGVYVLGAIDPAERSMVDAHLATCRDCRDELAGLASLPALLSRVSTAEAIALGTSDGPPFDVRYAGPGYPGAGETAQP